MKSKKLLSAPSDWLKETLIYDASSGYLYWEPEDEANKRKNNKHLPIGFNSKTKFPLVDLEGNNHSLHRVIYWLNTGEWPDIVMHKDGNTRNNRMDNLYPLTFSEHRTQSKDKGNIWEWVSTKGVKTYHSRVVIGKKSYQLPPQNNKIDALYQAWKIRDILYPGIATFPNCTDEEYIEVVLKYGITPKR